MDRKLGESGDSLRRITHRNEAGNYVVAPPRVLPRRVRAMVNERSLEAQLLSGRPLLGYCQHDDVRFIGQRAITTSSAPAPTVTNTGAVGIGWRSIRRSGGGSKERVFRTWGPFPFHHIVDPTGAMAGWSIIASDLIRVAFTSGTARAFFGFWSFNTSTDETSRVGAGFWADSTDDRWTSGVYDGTGTPSTTLHQTQHSSLPANATNIRLSVELNAKDKTVYFYADGVLVDSYTPAAPLAQMTNCPRFGYHLITNAAADCSIRTFGGGNPRIITYVPVD